MMLRRVMCKVWNKCKVWSNGKIWSNGKVWSKCKVVKANLVDKRRVFIKLVIVKVNREESEFDVSEQ
jgi:hypothetical protein